MSIIFMDGFDSYNGVPSNMLNGIYASVGSGMSLVTNIKRTGDYCLRSTQATNLGSGMRRFMGKYYTSLGSGGAVYFSELPNTNRGIFGFAPESLSPSAILAVGTDGALHIYHQQNGIIIASSEPGIIVAGAWIHIEWKVTIDPSNGNNGSIQVRVNGVTRLNLSGLNLGSNMIGFFGLSTSFTNFGTSFTTVYFDDIYVWNTEGTVNNDFIGDCRVRTIMPNQDTSISEWSVFGASNGFDAINDPSDDDDNSYLEASDNVPVTSSFNLENLPSETGAVHAVQMLAKAKKTETGVANLRFGVESDGVIQYGLTREMTTSYAYYIDVFQQNPSTGSNWDLSSVNNMSIYIQRVE